MSAATMSARNTGQAVRFLLAGAGNTLASYLLYLAMLNCMPYAAAYSAAYVVGIALSFFLNSLFVFKVRPTWRRFMTYPLIYVAQYAVGLAVVAAAVEWMGLSRALAMLLSIAVNVPLTYLLTRALLLRPSPSDAA
jgi:putative flippase GtrA